MELCGPAIALVVSVQGIVEVRRFKEKLAAGAAERQPWGCCPCPPAQPGRTAAQQQSVLRLDQKTTSFFRPDADNKTVLKMITGAIHVPTRTPKPFRINTRFECRRRRNWFFD